MKDPQWESPAKMGNPMFMGMCWGMAIQKTVYEANLKKYWPHTYRMYKAMAKGGL